MRIALMALAFLVAACTPTIPNTAAQSVYAAHGAYAAVLSAAVAYKNLPECAPSAPVVCKKADVVVVMQKADDAAAAVLAAAQATVRTPGVADDTLKLAVAAAVNSVTAFKTIVDKLGVQ